MTPSIDVIVPVHGNWTLTETCLRSLAAQSVPHRVFVVDDASPDDTLERLKDFAVDVIVLDRNRGFAAACNQGIRSGSGEIVVLVNNDVTADPRMLEHLARALTADERAGSAVPLLTRPDGRVDSFGLCADPTMAGFVRCVGMNVEEALEDPGPRLLGPYGAVAAFRRQALEDAGELDEGIFMYGEELDLALRLSARGWRTAAAPDSRGVHLGGATSGRASATQRCRAGFGRGYLLRAYGVIGSRYGLRTLATEAIVCLGDAVLSRDFASVRGRVAGWRAGRSAYRRSRTVPGVDRSIGFLKSLRMRVSDRRR